MYSFSQRKETKVVDEPYYAYYLEHSGADHPGREQTLTSQSTDIVKVNQNILDLSASYQNVFLKGMAHHMVGANFDFLQKWVNVFLIREPRQLIASFAQVIPNPKMEDIGAQRQYELFERLSTEAKKPVVVDSGELLKDPAKVLNQLCSALEIPFDPSMLEWEAGPIEEDGVWSEYWYHNVHRSTGFSKQKTSSRELPASCEPLYRQALPYYQKLYEHSIKA